jgi:integrase
MSIYRRKSPTGKRSRFYTAEFIHRGKLVRKGGFVDRESARHWRTSELLRVRRSATGFVKPLLNAQVIPLIEEFCQSLLTRGRDQKYAYIAEQRLRRLAGECCWQTLGNITRDGLETWAQSEPEFRGEKIGAKTINQFIEIAVEFGKWLTSSKVKRLPQNPLADAERLQAKLNNAYRRAGTIEEINRLLAKCPKDRRLYYLFRLYCPLRGKTIGGLTWGMLRLDGAPPWVALPAAINKSRRDERSPLRYDLAQQLRAAKGRAKADDLVFPTMAGLTHRMLMKAWRDDLAAAEIPYDDGKGNRRLDFHALRKTLVRLLKSSGVSLDQASLILHHKDIATTRKHYDDDAIQPELGEAMERLPQLGMLRRAE